MSKPLFRIEELIEALLKGSPDDPVYLRVGSSTYGIKAIDNGSIRVTSGKDTQDAAQVVKTLRRYASGTPKGEDTGIAWRIVGVGGGTAIRSVSYSNGKIVVRTLANEGKKMDAEVFESPYAGKGSLFKFGGGSDDALGGFTAKELTESSAIHGDFDHASLNYSGHQNVAARAEESSPDYDASAYDPLSESATPSGYDPVTFEAPRAKRMSKKKKKEKKQEPTYKQQHSSAVSSKIREIMHEYERTGMVGRSKPANKSAAVKQAVAVAYSMVNQSYRRSGKRLPAGVKRAEGEHSHPFDAPMGYGPMGPQPFYGNRRRLVRDRWGNLRFIRRRKDGTYMDNVDFGRSLKMDRRRQAKTWAPLGFRDQGDGSLDLLTSLMGAEGTDSDYYRFVYEIYDNNGETCYGSSSGYPIGGYAYASGSDMKEALGSIRSQLIDDMEREQRRITKAQSQNTAPRATARRNVAGARIVSVEQFSGFDDDGEETFVEIGSDLPADIKFNTAMAAEDDVFEASRRSGSDAGEGICGGCGKNSELRMNFGRRKMCYDCAMERYGAEDVYVHGDDGEARSIRVNKTHARNMSNLSEGATTTVKDQRKGTQHTVKRVGKGFDLAAEEVPCVECGELKETDISCDGCSASCCEECWEDTASNSIGKKGGWSAVDEGHRTANYCRKCEADYQKSRKGTLYAAESGDSVWVLILSTEGMNEMGGVYSSKDKAKQAFTKHLKDLGGDPADVDFDSYSMTVWYDNEDDPSLAYHSIRMYEEKLDSDFEMFGQ